jgi:hypothetical protein
MYSKMLLLHRRRRQQQQRKNLFSNTVQTNEPTNERRALLFIAFMVHLFHFFFVFVIHKTFQNVFKRDFVRLIYVLACLLAVCLLLFPWRISSFCLISVYLSFRDHRRCGGFFLRNVPHIYFILFLLPMVFFSSTCSLNTRIERRAIAFLFFFACFRVVRRREHV